MISSKAVAELGVTWNFCPDRASALNSLWGLWPLSGRSTDWAVRFDQYTYVGEGSDLCRDPPKVKIQKTG